MLYVVFACLVTEVSWLFLVLDCIARVRHWLNLTTCSALTAIIMSTYVSTFWKKMALMIITIWCIFASFPEKFGYGGCRKREKGKSLRTLVGTLH